MHQCHDQKNDMEIKMLYEANEEYEAMQQRAIELTNIKKEIFNKYFGASIIF